MAGICGIIVKSFTCKFTNFMVTIQSMVTKLGSNDSQIKSIHSSGNCYFGNVVSLNKASNDGFVFNEQFGIYCLIDGLVYLTESQKGSIKLNYGTNLILSDNDYLPYLYKEYGKDFIYYFTGWHNVFVYDERIKTAFLLNDRLGFLPLFIHESEGFFLFASRIESILASGLLNSITFDTVTIAEQLAFNYPLSNQTFIKDISTLPAASIYSFCNSHFTHFQYWSPAELIFDVPLSKRASIDIIDEAMANSLVKPISQDGGPFYLTITGGWDGRLILSYLLKNHRDRLRAFSFGADYSPDVVIPQKIAHDEGFFYSPIILDQKYIEKSFISFSDKTIMLSNGLRSYRRSHYHYAMQSLDRNPCLVVSGNFGDEIMKFANILPSEVISKDLINYVQSGFTKRPSLSFLIDNYLHTNNIKVSHITEEWNSRLNQIETEIANYDITSQKFNHIKLTRIANRYFGTEVSSYNDFKHNFSPFLDYDFLKVFNQTCYSANYYPFNANHVLQKQMTSLLYAKLIGRNYKKLSHYPTDRGFSISDLTNPFGKLAVYYKKYLQKKQPVNDPYFLEQTDSVFNINYSNLLDVDALSSEIPLLDISITNDINIIDKYLSLNYWMVKIAKEYLQ